VNKDLVKCGSSAELLKERQKYSMDGKIYLTKR
jgi:hypothetical protein